MKITLRNITKNKRKLHTKLYDLVGLKFVNDE
jgi:hypothetical protein